MNIVHFNYSVFGDYRAKVQRLEDALLAHPELHIPQDLHHHFSPGVYLRELRIPAGATLTGKIHRTAHLNILAAGEILVMTEHGVKHFTAPAIIHSSPGIKRAGHALTDCVWICVHPTDETDLDKLEDELIAPSFETLGELTVEPDRLLEHA